MNSKHTRLAFPITHQGDTVRDKDGFWVCRTAGDNDAERESIASEIERALNSHDALLAERDELRAALKDLLELAKNNGFGRTEFASNARAALAKARSA